MTNSHTTNRFKTSNILQLKQQLYPHLCQTPAYYMGNSIANRMGLQVARTIEKNLAYSLRPYGLNSQVKSFVETLNRDGILVIPNWLKPEQFEQLQQEILAHQTPQLGWKSHLGDDNLVWSGSSVIPEDNRYPLVKQYLQQNFLILQIVAAAVRRKIKHYPNTHIQFLRNEDPTNKNIDPQNVLHADLHYPTVKVSFFLDDHAQNNGTFVYAYGSHKITPARLIHEYQKSNKIAKYRQSKSPDIAKYFDRGMPILSPAERRNMNIVETQICAPANTLVIANTCGFHRRGHIQFGQERKEIRLLFRHVESWYHWLAKAKINY